jgi:(R,R)-butanediol dehydrogenase / meso-butanediol dehydrogenase / diacetyl reductase
MRGVVFRGARKLETLRIDDPVPGPKEVVVEMKASGMCGSDLHYYRGDPVAMMKARGEASLAARGIDPEAPVIAGHEPCGVIAALGAGTNPRFKVGDRVMIHHYDGCGCCGSCRTGWTQLCDEGVTTNGVLRHGGHADYIKVSDSQLVHLPEEISFVGGAAVSCGTGTAYGAMVRLDLSARDTLAVFGLGPVGLSAVQLASAMGVEVIGVDISAERVAKARAFGAAHAIDGSKLDAVDEIHKLTGGRGATCAMECAGGEIAKQQAVRATAPWGRIALVAIGGNLNVDGMKDIIAKQRTVIGSYTFSFTGMTDCARFIASHGVDLDLLFSDRWSLDQAEEAYIDFDKQTGGKGVFVF